MRVLVTGGAGFIGSHLVDELVAHGHDVLVIDSLHPGAHAVTPAYLDPRARYGFEDLNGSRSLTAFVDGVDAVCHHAARVGLGRDFHDVVGYVQDNDLGTAMLLRAMHAARFTGRIVLASSMVVYGDGRYRCTHHGDVRPSERTRDALAAGDFEPPCPRCGSRLTPALVSEDATTDPRSVYAATKLQQERLCVVFGREHGVEVTALRYHNVYGPRMPGNTPYAGVASFFRSALAEGRAPRVFEDGAQLRDFVHVRDVTRATVLAVERPQAYDGPLNIGSGTPRAVLDLARELCAATGSRTCRPIVTGEWRPGDVRHIVASSERARVELGFSAEVGFEAGIEEFARTSLRAAPAES